MKWLYVWGVWLNWKRSACSKYWMYVSDHVMVYLNTVSSRRHWEQTGLWMERYVRTYMVSLPGSDAKHSQSVVEFPWDSPSFQQDIMDKFGVNVQEHSHTAHIGGTEWITHLWLSVMLVLIAAHGDLVSSCCECPLLHVHAQVPRQTYPWTDRPIFRRTKRYIDRWI